MAYFRRNYEPYSVNRRIKITGTEVVDAYTVIYTTFGNYHITGDRQINMTHAAATGNALQRLSREVIGGRVDFDRGRQTPHAN